MKILVALDDSDYSKKALDKGVRLAKALQGELFLLSVIPHVGVVEEMSPGMVEKLERETRDIVEQARDRAVKAGVTPKVRVESGLSPADRIIAFAQEKGVEMIVVGHRGKTNLERFLVGSVASSLVTYAPCSVLVVK